MKVYLVAIPLMVMLITGCATHGSGKAEQDLSQCKSLCFGETDPFDQIYAPQVAGRLKEFGFEVVTDTSQPNTLVCKIASSEGGSFDWGFQVSLWRGEKRLLLAESRNNDFRSLGNPQAAKYRVVEDAVEKLETKLRKIRSAPQSE
jgi:hypothetical protein